jgi:hypothetical protein
MHKEPDQDFSPLDRYGYRPLPAKIPKLEMDDFMLHMSGTEKDRAMSNYVLDTNCLDENNCPAPEYVLADKVGNIKAVEAKEAFAALRIAVEKKYGKLQGLPR